MFVKLMGTNGKEFSININLIRYMHEHKDNTVWIDMTFHLPTDPYCGDWNVAVGTLDEVIADINQQTAKSGDRQSIE